MASADVHSRRRAPAMAHRNTSTRKPAELLDAADSSYLQGEDDDISLQLMQLQQEHEKEDFTPVSGNNDGKTSSVDDQDVRRRLAAKRRQKQLPPTWDILKIGRDAEDQEFEDDLLDLILDDGSDVAATAEHDDENDVL